MRLIVQDVLRDGNGVVIRDATVNVYLAGTTTPANVYTTLTGTTAVASVTTDSTNGSFLFYVDAFEYGTAQEYKVVGSKPSLSADTYTADNVKAVPVIANYTISTAKTANYPMVIPYGVTYTQSGSGSIVFNAAFEAGLYQVFIDSTGTAFTFGDKSTDTIRPEWWGAIADGTTDNTLAFSSAISASTIGKKVKYGTGSFATNITITKTNTILEGSSAAGMNSAITSRLVPYDTSKPVVKIGNDTGYIRGCKLQNIYIYSTGPSGEGTIGLELAGGAYEGYFDTVSINGAFSQYNLKIQSGTTYAIAYNMFNGIMIQTNSGVSNTATLGIYKGTQYSAANFFNNVRISGPSAGTGYAIVIDSATLYMTNTWIQVANSGRGINFSNASGGVPRLKGSNIVVDSDSSSDNLINSYQSTISTPTDILYGGISIDGKVLYADATTLSVVDINQYSYTSSCLTYPQLIGAAYFAQTSNPTDVTAEIYQDANDLNLKHSDGGIIFTTESDKKSTFVYTVKNSSWVEQVKGANVASANTITATNTVFHVTGTDVVKTINLPYTGFVGRIDIIPDGAFTTDTSGNIAISSTAVVGKILTMIYDGSKWYPSY